MTNALTDPATSDKPLLTKVLHENAIFSVLSGAGMAFGGAAIDDWLGVNQWLLIAVGVGLLGFAAYLLWGTAKATRLVATGRTAIAGDVGWVAGTLALVGATDYLTSNGETLALLICVPVALFAVGQAIGLGRLQTARATMATIA